MSNPPAIVLGGSAGVGYATVAALIERGRPVGVVARSEERLAEMRDRFGDRIATAAADVADAAALEAATDSLVATLGAPDIWVNNAMMTSFSPFDKVGPEEFDRIVGVSFLGQVNGARIALRVMERGSIVHVSSGLAYRPVPLQTAYCASKHALNGFVGSLRSELIQDERPITLSLVQLPAMNTPQFDWALNRLEQKPQPAPPIYTPEVGARAILKAIDDKAREIMVGKSVLQLTFATLVAPDWMDRKLATAGISSQKSGTKEPGGRPNNMDAPVTYPARSEGSFSDRAQDKAFTIDGDMARYAVFGGAVLAAFLLGLILG